MPTLIILGFAGADTIQGAARSVTYGPTETVMPQVQTRAYACPVLFGVWGTADLLAFTIPHLLAPRFELIDSPPGGRKRRSHRQRARRSPWVG